MWSLEAILSSRTTNGAVNRTLRSETSFKTHPASCPSTTTSPLSASVIVLSSTNRPTCHHSMQLRPTSGTLSTPVRLGNKMDSPNTRRQSKHLLPASTRPLRWTSHLESPDGVIENEDWTPNNLDNGMLRVNEQIRYQ